MGKATEKTDHAVDQLRRLENGELAGTRSQRAKLLRQADGGEAECGIRPVNYERQSACLKPSGQSWTGQKGMAWRLSEISIL